MDIRRSALEDLVRQDFWKGKRIFLTGHTGFKGSWLSLWLQKLGANVTGYSLIPSTNPSLFEVAHVGRNMKSIIGDICNIESLKQSMQSAQPDIAIHMAAQSLVHNSYKDPVETYATNVMGTVKFLEAVRNTPTVKAVIIVTSDKCYENKEQIWGYREDESLGGYDPYSNSKGCAELVTAAYRSSFFNRKNYKNHGVSIATVRAGNVIGGGDWSENRLIPDIIKSFTNNTKVHIRNPNSIRPWQYVLEPLRGYLMLAEKLFLEGSSYGEAWNFGPLDEGSKKVSWVVNKMSEFFGKTNTYTDNAVNNYHETRYLKVDSSKANMRLNWNQLLHLQEALYNIFDWYNLFSNKADMHYETLRQIQDYEKKIIQRQ